MTAKPRICFVGLDSYPVLNPAKGGEYFGGESVQQVLLARAFRDLGYDVSMIVKDHGQPQNEIIDDIRVLKTFEEHAGVPVLRFFHPRLTSIIAALSRADADIYYQSCAGMLTGVVAWFCRRYGRRFIFRIASDSDCFPGQQLIRLWRDRKLYEYGLRRADVIAAQGIKQVALLKEHYGLDSVPVNMVVQVPDELNEGHRDIDILWVNNFRGLKRPEMVLELAAALPKYQFVMIGGPVPGSEHLYEQIVAGARSVTNLETTGAVPYHEVNSFFSRARLFINTSEIEGFPNSFLQAWIREVPVVSFFDPDDLIRTMGMGAVADSILDMVSKVRMLLEDDEKRQAAAKVARRYVLDNYAPGVVARQYAALVSGWQKN